MANSLEEYQRVTADQTRRFWEGLENAERFFMDDAPVQHALRKIARVLEADGTPYVVVGGLALNMHGHRRVTTDVDLILTAAGLEEFKARHLGRGWVNRFPGSRGLRDTEFGVDIDIILSGGYPGDGKPKPIRFPDPSVGELRDGVRLIPLIQFLELKLASGLSVAHRVKDIADVLELIRSADLRLEVASSLDPSVRAEYERLHALAEMARHDEISEPPTRK